MCILVFYGILTVCQFAGINFLLDDNTGMTKIPSLLVYCPAVCLTACCVAVGTTIHIG